MIREFSEISGGRYTVICESEYGDFRTYTGGMLKRDRHGFYRFYAKPKIILSLTDCRMLADKLNELNIAAGNKS